MDKPNTIKIDEIEYVRKDSITTRDDIKGDLFIVVLQRGFVAVGYRSVGENGDYILSKSANIRIWGTTKGLGEIAEDGPTSKTILDRCTPIEYHPLTAIMHIRCKEESWKKVL